MSPLYKRETYQYKHQVTSFRGLYRNQISKNAQISAIPFMELHHSREQRINPFSGTKINYYILGLNVDYKQSFGKNKILSLDTGFSKKNIIQSTNALATLGNAYMNRWIIADYQYLTSDINTYYASLRYDFKLKKLPALFVSGYWQKEKIQNRNNHLVSLNLGITF